MTEAQVEYDPRTHRNWEGYLFVLREMEVTMTEPEILEALQSYWAGGADAPNRFGMAGKMCALMADKYLTADDRFDPLCIPSTEYDDEDLKEHLENVNYGAATKLSVYEAQENLRYAEDRIISDMRDWLSERIQEAMLSGQ